MKKVIYPKTIEICGLTTAEKKIVALRASGYSIKEMADALYVSDKTVQAHLSNIKHKLGFVEPIRIAQFAGENGLINMDKWKRGERPAFGKDAA